MRDIERLAIAQAVYKAVASEVKTGEDNLRGRADAEVLGLYESTGARSFDARVNGKKVGTYSVRVTEPRTDTVLEVSDADALYRWADAHGFLVPDMDAIRGHFADTGEVPDGARPVTVEVEGRATTSLRVEPMKVAEALGSELPGAVMGLLGGEDGR